MAPHSAALPGLHSAQPPLHGRLYMTHTETGLVPRRHLSLLPLPTCLACVRCSSHIPCSRQGMAPTLSCFA